MADLLRDAQLFATCSKLKRAARSLRAIAEENGAAQIDVEALKWVGAFLSEVDWASKIERGEGVQTGLAVQTTVARPSFYRVIRELIPQFQEQKISSSRQISSFLNKLYRMLVAGGEQDDTQIASAKLELAANLLSRLARSILAQLSNNGVPPNQTAVVTA